MLSEEDGFMLTQSELDAMFEAIREREMNAELALNAMLKSQIAAVLPSMIDEDKSSME